MARGCSENGVSRRGFLAAVGSGAGVVLSGCGGVTSYEFGVDPVVLAGDARERLAYRERSRGSAVAKRSRSVRGVEVTATVESHVAVYEPTDGAPARAATPTVGAVSTPAASIRGRSFNPLARLSLAGLLTSEAGVRVLRRAGLNEVGHRRDRVRWRRGPTAVGGRAGSCLGHATGLESYAGVVAGDPPSVAVVHLARVDDDSVVIPAAVHGHDVEEPGRALVGPEKAYLSPGEVKTAVDVLARVAGGLQYGSE